MLGEEQPAASGSEWGLEHPWRRGAALWCESKGAGAGARPHVNGLVDPDADLSLSHR